MPTNLSDFRVDEQEIERAETQLADALDTLCSILPGMSVIAFDQSMAHTGWAVITRPFEGDLRVIQTGDYKTSPNSRIGKTEDKLVRCSLVGEYIHEVVLKWRNEGVGSLAYVVHETPLAGGGRVMNTDSSLGCSVGVRLAASNAGVPVAMVSNQTMRRHLTGKQGGDKSEIAEAVRRRFPALSKTVGPLNEATWDAIGLGLTFLEGK